MYWLYPSSYPATQPSNNFYMDTGPKKTKPGPFPDAPEFRTISSTDCGYRNKWENIRIKNERPASPLPYGPYTCKQGYVWREAVPGDFVCVTPQTREETANENALGPSRRQPGGGAYGPDTCKQGFVWRETRPSDHVCVPPQRREQAKADNINAPHTMVYPPAAPSNGIRVWDNLTNGVMYYMVDGTFTPNAEVAFYVYGAGNRPYMMLLKKIRANVQGKVTFLNPIFHWFKCPWYNGLSRAHIIVVDEGSGIVSNAGNVANPYCTFG